MNTIPTTASLVLSKRIGSGGFGEVWLARRISSGIEQEVAVKILKMDIPQQEFVHRLRDEARLLARLKHSSIVKMMDFTSIEGQPAVIMEYVEGVDLKELIEAGPMPLRVVLQIGINVASAMTEAHGLKDPITKEPLTLIHRDLKPENIRITPRGEVKLLDFGIAKATFEEREAKSAADLLMGSKGYMPPERMLLQDEQAGDVYSLALVLAEACIGKKVGQCPIVVTDIPIWQVKYQQWQEGIRAKLKNTPEKFIALILRCTAFAPDQRPTMPELEAALDALSEHSSGMRLKDWVSGALNPKEEDVSMPHVSTPDTVFTKASTVQRVGVGLLMGGVAIVTMLMVLGVGGMFLWGVMGKEATPSIEPIPVVKVEPPQTEPPKEQVSAPVPPNVSPTPSSSQKVKTIGAEKPKPVSMSSGEASDTVVPPPTPLPPPVISETGSIHVQGASAQLKGGGNLDSVSPGSHGVEVTFSSGKTITITVNVEAGKQTTIKCQQTFETCK